MRKTLGVCQFRSKPNRGQELGFEKCDSRTVKAGRGIRDEQLGGAGAWGGMGGGAATPCSAGRGAPGRHGLSPRATLRSAVSVHRKTWCRQNRLRESAWVFTTVPAASSSFLNEHDALKFKN